jgi:RNA recognition motif-containing protein
LSVRNLPKAVGDNDLKVMCIRALKAGLGKGNVTTTDILQQLTAQGIDYRKPGAYPAGGDSQVQSQSASRAHLEIPSHTIPSCIKSAKVMLDLKRLKNGVPQSRSYGFVEFTHHVHALSCLRELNNSLDYAKYLPEVCVHTMTSNAATMMQRPQRLMVEFSLENYNKVH